MQPPLDNDPASRPDGVPAEGRDASKGAEPAERVPLLLVIGPPGVGKTSAARQVSRLLEDAGIASAYVDRDEFGRDGLLFEDPLVELEQMLRGFVADGARRLVVAWRIDCEDELAQFRASLPWAHITVCRLRAETRALLDRIADGQQSFQRMHLQSMAMEMTARLERQATQDILLATDDASPYAVAVSAFRQWPTFSAAARPVAPRPARPRPAAPR
ncbi:MAG TPA: AAA family ATPase [Solirubrobacteraceae bacterium]|nr:AAA family ATPase [Solirubrobacteraceae bacterium]